VGRRHGSESTKASAVAETGRTDRCARKRGRAPGMPGSPSGETR
jgi:hypothetical protein